MDQEASASANAWCDCQEFSQHKTVAVAILECKNQVALVSFSLVLS